MNELKREYVYVVKQYQKTGFAHAYHFVDAYANGRLEKSIMIDRPLSNEELERFFNVFLERLNKGNDVDFIDSTERRMNNFLIRDANNLSILEKILALKMGEEKFNLHYEKRCYYLVWSTNGLNYEHQETFHISKTYHPLACLKMAYQMGEKLGVDYKILLSDHTTAVDSELLAFAISEN